MTVSLSLNDFQHDGIGVQLMSPISPMLAEACKSVEKAIEKCPEGMYSEIKYDGERIQLHKKGDEFRYVPNQCTISLFEFRKIYELQSSVAWVGTWGFVCKFYSTIILAVFTSHSFCYSVVHSSTFLLYCFLMQRTRKLPIFNCKCS